LQEALVSWGSQPYRAYQIFNWVYHHGVKDFDAMTNLSKAVRARLKATYTLALPRIREKSVSGDGSIKYLFELEDGAEIESVWMPAEDRYTLCLSTQVGC
ncbi:MAG: 23S rRNA (adenine(2503)-C(2))-methyltransferase RlmN, partial [Nitrospinaceae bacterium]|nr:23S rRNA (adenine(2503)-C(2))-methyltransferase RlmN [Nitrospinaceae bacterium]NIR56680.1 23S rRNA (adenine(2503)-C(2))-methyltransferase RlmN [Nitrospinaceae bacterium]NIS87143.1 23S rRNA (adenine(2503)-C(2))-methyltransferase RlmN [Nitrospinaceae bacterium]NIT83997.1 23S rRNA (adenine(2503)-C(2))-methyltransferase RlmN [Nitrospinaceae bacterium]NIU46187.1 23S rRNA (adenine(2503)-C(2))-methyltransferase RlmN [Nitrospinaceae bacterium]